MCYVGCYDEFCIAWLSAVDVGNVKLISSRSLGTIYSFFKKRTLSFSVYCLHLPTEEYKVSGSKFPRERK